MAKTNTTHNEMVKAIITHLNEMRLKKHISEWERNVYLQQYKMVSSNMRVGVIGHKEMKEMYSRERWQADGAGATKVVHKYFHEYNEDGKIVSSFEFTDIVVKRIRKDLLAFLGNQGLKEIEMWEKYHDTELAEILCPILKYFTSKSDKVTEMSETMLNNVVIIAQKAIEIGDITEACEAAENLNRIYRYHGTSAKDREDEILRLVKKYGIRDVIGHGGNSGVVFDYSKGCYKAVLVDYGL